MSVMGSPRTVTELDIRLWLRDNDPAANLLVRDLEFDNKEVDAALARCVDYFNELPPDVGGEFTLDSFPYRHSLMTGACAQLLYIAANRFRRNDLPITAGGVSVNDQAKHAQYDAAGDKLWQQFREFAQRKKIGMNMEQCWGFA